MDKKKSILKLLSILLILIIPLANIAVFPNNAVEVVAEGNDFAGGDGSKKNPYLISAAEQLHKVRDYLDDTIYYFKLVNDIDLTDFISSNDNTKGWLPIGDYANQFNGHLDGAGYTISGLWIDRKEIDFVGLFARIGNKSTISNLGIEINSNYGVTGYEAVGGLVGSNEGGKITDSYVKGNITGNISVGGLVGENYEGRIINSYFTGNVNGFKNVEGFIESKNVGGLIGYNNDGTVNNSYFSGNVNGSKNAGGLIGDNHGSITYRLIGYNLIITKVKGKTTSKIKQIILWIALLFIGFLGFFYKKEK